MIIINQIPPSHPEKILAMLQKLHTYLQEGKRIQRIFFYAEAVWQCTDSSNKPWLAFHELHDISLSVCPNAVVRRNIEALVAEPFTLCSLTQLFFEMSRVDEVACFD